MAMGRREDGRQTPLWIAGTDLPEGPGHPFYKRLNKVLSQHEFDRFVEGLCRGFYARKMGRPSIPPGVYFRMLMVGYFEGIDSERGIAWRCADSLSLKAFLGYALQDAPPDHSTISRTRRLISVEAHQEVFAWILGVLADQDLLEGKTLGVDATTLEANAAMRSVVHRRTCESYREFLTRLAKASGIETPTLQDLKRIDKGRKGKGSNEDWEHPHDPDAQITKMKDGRTHMGHKAEHAVDMDTGAVVAVTVQDPNKGDTRTVGETLSEAIQNLEQVAQEHEGKAPAAQEVVADKGYHSNDVLRDLEELGLRTYVSEPERGRRRWEGKHRERDAVYGNRWRIRGERGKRLMRRRGEVLERPFAHLFGTGRMRRAHLRRRGNILKRLLIHSGALNLGLVMRKLMGAGTPRGLEALALASFFTPLALMRAVFAGLARFLLSLRADSSSRAPFGCASSPPCPGSERLRDSTSNTGC
jgi:transposase